MMFRFSDISAALILPKRQQKMFSSFKNTLRKFPLRENGETLAMSNPVPRTEDSGSQALSVAVTCTHWEQIFPSVHQWRVGL